MKGNIDDLAREKNVLLLNYNKMNCPNFVYQGGFGITYSGTYLNNIKILTKKMIKNNLSFENFCKELKNLKLLRHPNIPLFYGISQDCKDMMLVQQFVEGNTLSKFLKEKITTDVEKMLILLDLAKVLEYLHGFRFIHKDLKPENVMIDYKTLKMYLIDFGITKDISQKSDACNTVSELEGSIMYMAPESFDLIDITKKTSEKSQKTFFQVSTKFDVWSYGCLADEVFSGNKPWMNAETNLIQFNLTIKKDYQFQKMDHIPKYNEFIKSCCENDLQLRFDIQQTRAFLMKIFFKDIEKLLKGTDGSVTSFMKLDFISNSNIPRLSMLYSNK